MSLNTILATTPLTSTNYVLKATGTTIGNSLIWDNGTNVGIGNTNTTYKLDVSGTGNFTGALSGTSATFSSSVTAGSLIVNQASTAADIILKFAIAGTPKWLVGLTNDIVDDNFTIYQDGAGGGNRFTINTSGNVGIGISAPVGKLQVYKNGLSAVIGKMSDANILVDSADYGVNTYTSQIAFGYYSGTFTYAPVAIGFISTSGSGAGRGDLTFNTRDTTTDVAPTERMRITSDGIVKIRASMQTTINSVTVEYSNDGYGGYAYVYGAYGYRFYTNGVERLTISSSGAVTVNGSFSAGSKSFLIPHPLTSLKETHNLRHTSVESPQADLIYRGKLTLINGKAQANIDKIATMTYGTFEALCREVQCFTTNESGWDLVKGKVIGNVIYIESQNPNSIDEISWMVIGERKDAFMMDTNITDDNGKVIVEPLKTIKPIIEMKETSSEEIIIE